MHCSCGDKIAAKRFALGYRTCLPCGEKEARQKKFTIANLHKSNYIVVTNLDDLKGLNNKGGLVK
jgi:hypothetical protein